MRRRDANPVTVELPDIKEGECVTVGVSVGAKYYKDTYLQALLICLANNPVSIGKITFLVGDRLQRHTLLLKELPKIEQLKQSIREVLKSKGAYKTVILQKVEDKDLQNQLIKAIENKDGEWEAIIDKRMEAICLEKSEEDGKEWFKNFNDIFFGQGKKKSNFPNYPAPAKLLGIQDKPKAIENNGGEYSDKLRVVFWASYTERQEKKYKETRSSLQIAYDENTERFRNIVDEAATAFLNKLIEECQNEGGNLDEELSLLIRSKGKKLCLEYILEESAVFWMLMEEGSADALAYPFDENETNTKLYQCIATLSKLMKDRQLNGQEADSSKSIMRPTSIVFKEENRKSQKLTGKSELNDSVSAMMDTLIKASKGDVEEFIKQIEQDPAIGADRKAMFFSYFAAMAAAIQKQKQQQAAQPSTSSKGWFTWGLTKLSGAMSQLFYCPPKHDTNINPDLGPRQVQQPSNSK